MAVLLQTSVGDLTIDLYVDKAPLPCYNFLGLVRAKYYHNIIFHSIEKNFIARAGNPATASRSWGIGLPGTLSEPNKQEKQTDDVGCSIWGLRHLIKTRQLNLRRREQAIEMQRKQQQGRLSLLPASVYADVAFDMVTYAPFPNNPSPGTGIPPKTAPSSRFCPLDCNLQMKHTKRGLLGMLPHAEGKAPGGTSCFYLTLRPNLTQLDGRHSLFGEVVEGLDTLDKINDAFVDSHNIPLTPVRILRAYILGDPFFCKPAKLVGQGAAAEDEEQDIGEVDTDKLGMTPPASPEPLAAEALSDEEMDEIMAIEKVDHKEAEARKVTLEILGDLPDADLAPPETVLFVAKLNPATQDDDLRLIFSRFGEVVSCDIIRDTRTGQSLQYAFVGFKKKEECEAAFFKMQNVLVDDRRKIEQIVCGCLALSIHVDFSQSVAREWRSFKLQQFRTPQKQGSLSASAQFQKTNEPQSYARQHRARQQQERPLSQHAGSRESPRMPEGKQHRDFGSISRQQHQRGTEQHSRSRSDFMTESEKPESRINAIHAGKDRASNRRDRSRSRSPGRR